MDGGRAARDRRHLLLPVLHAIQCARRLDQRRRAQLRLPALGGTAGRRVRRRDVLRDVFDEAAAAARCCTSATISRAGRRVGTHCRAPSTSVGGPKARRRRKRHDVAAQSMLGTVRSRARSAAHGGRRRSATTGSSRRSTRPARSRSLSGGRSAGAARYASARTSADRRLRLLQRVGVVDPASLDDYRAHGGYARSASAPSKSARRASSLKSLRRSSSAAAARRFPTGRKLQSVARAPARPHYVICNADESEPGTFKDRILMENDPFAMVEAMTIAAFAAGCEHGFIYIRGEYPLAARRLAARARRSTRKRPARARHSRQRLRFDVEIRRGAGAYICGEETALFNSIEGKRGEPRSKPPFPVEAGLFGKPTLVNNVETLCEPAANRARRRRGVRAHRHRPIDRHALFCLSGAVARPGLYEVAHGATLGDVLELAGGVRRRTDAAGDSARRRRRRVSSRPTRSRCRFRSKARAPRGATLGSGVVMVFDDMLDLHGDRCCGSRAFFRDESCGQCVPCRVGTVRQEEALHRLVSAAGAQRSQRRRAAQRNRPRDARRVDLRPGPDRRERDRVRARRLDIFASGRSAMIRGPMPHDPPQPAEAHGRPDDRRRDGRVSGRLDDSRRLPQRRHETPTLCFLADADARSTPAASASSSSKARACWSRPARAKPKPGWSCSTDSERVRHSRKMVLEFLASSVDLSTAPEAQRVLRAVRRRSRALRIRRRRHRRAAGEGRQRPLRSRLLEVHSLLQVRRSLRNRRTEYLRDRRRRPRVRRAHFDRIRRAAARFGVRVLRQLHRRLPDRRADVFVRARHACAPARGTNTRQTQADTICPYCGVGCTLRLQVQDNESSRSPRRSRTASRTAICASRAGSERSYVQNREAARGGAMTRDEASARPGPTSKPRFSRSTGRRHAQKRQRRHRRAARASAGGRRRRSRHSR